MTPPFALAALFAPSPNTNPMVGVLIQVALIFGIFYFIVMRPQAKQRQEHERSLKALKKGDEVITQGGIVGDVIHIKESTKDGQPVQTMEDRITIKSGESRLVVERGRISKVNQKVAEPGPAA
ncbi:MAG TPA: preprotein translocase subunit YajC [Gemmatimonadaceae bacterium]|nr:preprotein translocase subunit YajC [Gemmatimonadaceae bacterium]